MLLGGVKIQHECDRHIQQLKERQLPTGGVFTSGAGTLPCKKIVHAVGPKWAGGMSTQNFCLKVLMSTRTSNE